MLARPVVLTSAAIQLGETPLAPLEVPAMHFEASSLMHFEELLVASG
jgi:hypothetical protein